MEEQRVQLEDGGSNPTSPLHCHQYLIRVEESRYGSSPVQNPDLRTSRIQRISLSTAKPIVLRYEWLKSMPGFSSMAFGHFFDGVLGGVAVLGHTTGSDVAFRKMFPNKKIIVLQRGVHLWWTPPNSASWFLSRICKMLRKEGYDIITATADEEAGEIGTIYQALNWSYLGAPKHGHPVFVFDDGLGLGLVPTAKEIHPRALYRRHGTSSCGKIKTIYKDRMTIKPRVFKHRYAYALDRSLVIPSLPYPKRRSADETEK